MDAIMNGKYLEITASNHMFKVVPIDRPEDIDRTAEYKKLNLSPSQNIQVSGLFQQLPALAATEMLSESYILKFPEGMSEALHPMNYQTGGIGTPLQNADGKIVGHATLQSFSGQAVILSAFNAMSIASGQYFLAQINKELKMMNKSIDKILEFLYNDKKAELVSEVSFVKSAYQNYSSIMEHEQQRLATIVNLQGAKKVAMKDIEFYVHDLDSKVDNLNKSKMQSDINEISETKECLDLSLQLYIMANLLEVYYTQNYDVSYISHIEKEATIYVAKCEKKILSSFSKLITLVRSAKEGPIKKFDKTALEEKVVFVIDSLASGTETDIVKSFRTAIHAMEKDVEYYIRKNGELYVRSG